MQRAGRIKICFFVLCLAATVALTDRAQARAAEGPIGKYVFEYCHTGYGASGSQQTFDGFFVDNEGVVWSFDHGDYQWSPGKSEGPFYENELRDKYGTVKQVGTVDKSVLSAMASLIEPATEGEPASQGRRVAGMDSMTCNAYLYDAGQDTYKEVVLSVKGSGAMQNTSSAARTLVSWLEQVFFKGRPSNPPEPVHAETKPRPAGIGKPHLSVIQKIPAPKPEIKADKIEIRGPFPVEEPAK